MKKLVMLAVAVGLSTTALPAYAADSLPTLANKTCHIGFSGNGPKASGSGWLTVSANPAKADYKRKWGPAVEPVALDSDFEPLGEVTLTSNKDGSVTFVVNNTFTWTMTPTGAPGKFKTTTTGGKVGSTGTATCS